MNVLTDLSLLRTAINELLFYFVMFSFSILIASVAVYSCNHENGKYEYLDMIKRLNITETRVCDATHKIVLQKYYEDMYSSYSVFLIFLFFIFLFFFFF